MERWEKKREKIKENCDLGTESECAYLTDIKCAPVYVTSHDIRGKGRMSSVEKRERQPQIKRHQLKKARFMSKRSSIRPEMAAGREKE